MKKLILFIAVVLAGCSFYFAYGKYQQYQFISAATPVVKNISIRSTKAARYELGGESNVTYKEIFERLEEHLKEVDNKIIDIQSISNDANKEQSSVVINYLQASQEFMRTVLQQNRKQLASSSAIQSLTSSMSDLRASVGTYGYEYASKAAGRSIEEAKNAVSEQSEAVKDLIAATKNLAKAAKDAEKLLPSNALISQETLSALIKKLAPEKEKEDPKKPS